MGHPSGQLRTSRIPGLRPLSVPALSTGRGPVPGALPVLDFDPEPLVPYGWDDRVLARFAAERDAVTVRTGGAHPEPLPARVTRVQRASCLAVLPDGSEQQLRGDPLPAVGDWVTTVDGLVIQVLPRWSEVTRVDPSGSSLQVLAANADIVAVVAPADRHSPARIERELALAWDSGAVPLVVVTKSDLDGGVAVQLAERIPGVDVLSVSAVTGTGLEDLRERLTPHRTCLFLGPSGAGKSTLANALAGEARLATGATREGDGRGRHTTTTRQLLVIPSGGIIIDTPGIRGLTLPRDVELGLGFADIAGLAKDCRFANCRHEQEPGCAVNAAVNDGTLDVARLVSFRKLTREVAFQQSRQDPLARRADRQVWSARTKPARAGTRRPRP